VLDARAAKQLKKLKFGYEINELSWTFNSDHILIATGGSEMGGVDIVSFDGTELTQVLPLSSSSSSSSHSHSPGDHTNSSCSYFKLLLFES
jgi:hypothetical protein